MNTEMRRKDRMMAEADAYALLQRGLYGVLSTVCADHTPYGVPMSYALHGDRIYFHCAAAGGLRTANLRSNSAACFTVTEDVKTLPEKFSTEYASVIVFGQIEIAANDDEKRAGLTALLEKYSADFLKTGRPYLERTLDKADVFWLKIDRLTGKARKAKPHSSGTD